nr:MAG TPA: hypothetical protein [Caudoviricetes sp.]
MLLKNKYWSMGNPILRIFLYYFVFLVVLYR